MKTVGHSPGKEVHRACRELRFKQRPGSSKTRGLNGRHSENPTLQTDLVKAANTLLRVAVGQAPGSKSRLHFLAL